MPKYYKDYTLNKEVVDLSGKKLLESLRIEYNLPNLIDVTDKVQAEISKEKTSEIEIGNKKEKEITSNFSSWKDISESIDKAKSLDELKVTVKKIARVLYWIARNKED